MTWLKHHYIIFTAIWLLAVILRINELDIRPFHVDEAVNGLITGNLLAEGSYTYNPGDYHGPVLYYLTLPLLKLAGIDRISDISESMLRLLPALAGSMLVLLLIPLRRFIPARASSIMCFPAGNLTNPGLLQPLLHTRNAFGVFYIRFIYFWIYISPYGTAFCCNMGRFICRYGNQYQGNLDNYLVCCLYYIDLRIYFWKKIIHFQSHTYIWFYRDAFFTSRVILFFFSF